MRFKYLIILLFVFLLEALCAASAQKIIQYEAGMGSRDPQNADVWILYNTVEATHEGMTLYADSATFDTKNNIFTAYNNVVMYITDTTILYGHVAIYDGTLRLADIRGDTVTLVDGGTTLKTDMLTYDRNDNTAFYFNWGHTTNGSSTCFSRRGVYNSDTRDLFLFYDVVLTDSNSRLETDSLHYNTETELAVFTSPTYIFSDSSSVYSEHGTYNTSTHEASSYKASQVVDREKILICDTLFFNDSTEHGEAYGNVHIIDTLNNVHCFGKVGITDRESRMSFVTDSALIVYVEKGDSLFMHADSIWAYNDTNNSFDRALVYRNVSLFRKDVQGLCDSAVYSAADSVLSMYYDPVVWYEDYQCVADTIVSLFDTSGIRTIFLNNNVFAIERVDTMRYNQVKGHNAVVNCRDGEPQYTDIHGSAQMIYYVTDDDSGRKELMGVNIGIGSDIRIYFVNKKADRVVTYGEPDMTMHPPLSLKESERTLDGFKWRSSERPRNKRDVFKLRNNKAVVSSSPHVLLPAEGVIDINK